MSTIVYNIVFICHAQLWNNNNAASARVTNYIRALSAFNGFRFYLLSDDANLSLIHRVNDNIFINTAESGRMSKIKSSILFYKSLPKFVESLEGKVIFIVYPSVYHITEFLFLCRIKTFRKKGYKSFCEINELRRYDSSLTTYPALKRILYVGLCCIMEKRSRLYDGLLCISSNIKRYYSKYNKRSIVIPILSDIIPGETEGVREKAKNIMNFVFTGTVSMEKENLFELLKGFYLFNKRNKDWVFNIYGRISNTDRTTFIDLVETYGIQNKVILNGEIPRDSVSGVLASADCLILSRRNIKQNYYGFSTKLSEYAVARKPIILTNTGVVKDYFSDGYNCLMLEGYEAEDFEMKLLEFSQMPVSQKERLGDNAYKTAQDNFSWKNYSDILYDFLIH